jgi:hypothetical protein
MKGKKVRIRYIEVAVTLSYQLPRECIRSKESSDISTAAALGFGEDRLQKNFHALGLNNKLRFRVSRNYLLSLPGVCLPKSPCQAS